jgi:hypothetical protein
LNLPHFSPQKFENKAVIGINLKTNGLGGSPQQTQDPSTVNPHCCADSLLRRTELLSGVLALIDNVEGTPPPSPRLFRFIELSVFSR